MLLDRGEQLRRHKITDADERTVTVRLHVPWDAESSQRLYGACRTQDGCWNLAVEWLADHPDEPLRKSRRLGVKGLQGRWLEWREQHGWAKKVPQATRRGGILRAREQVQRWEEVNEQHAGACLKATRNGKLPPRRVHRRDPDPKKLFRRRKERDGRRRNSCVITESVRRIDRQIEETGMRKEGRNR